MKVTERNINSRVYFIKDNEIHCSLFKDYILSHQRKVDVGFGVKADEYYVDVAYNIEDEVMGGNGNGVVFLYEEKEAANFFDLAKEEYKQLYTLYIRLDRNRPPIQYDYVFLKKEKAILHMLNLIPLNDVYYFHERAVVENYIRHMQRQGYKEEEIREKAVKRVKQLMKEVTIPKPPKKEKEPFWKRFRRFIRHYRYY